MAEVIGGITSERALQRDAATATAAIASMDSRSRAVPRHPGVEQRGCHTGGGRRVQRRLGGLGEHRDDGPL